VERSQWVWGSSSGPAASSSNTMASASRVSVSVSGMGERSGSGVLYRCSRSGLSPPPLSNAARPSTPAMESNLTRVDHATQSLASSLIMFAFNSLIIHRFISPLIIEPIQRVSLRQLPRAIWQAMPNASKFYMLCNTLGLLAAVRRVTLELIRRRTRHHHQHQHHHQRQPHVASSIHSNTCASVSYNGGEEPGLPLLLPSFTFMQLVHALFLQRSERINAASMSDGNTGAAAAAASAGLAVSSLVDELKRKGASQTVKAAVKKTVAAATTTATATPTSELRGMVTPLPIMVLMSFFYWNLHHKHTEGEGEDVRPMQVQMQNGSKSDGEGGDGSGSVGMAAHPSSASSSSSSSSSSSRESVPWVWNPHFTYNMKLVACIILFTKLLA